MRAIILALALVTPAFGEVRTWMDAAGTHTVQAELSAVNGDIAVLKIGDRYKSVPIDKLCVADQQYVAKHPVGNELNGNVVAVTDGNRIVVRTDAPRTAQLVGVDAPTGNEPFADEAKRALQDKALGHEVRVRWKERSSDGTIQGHVYYGDRWLNNEIVGDGWGKYDKAGFASDDLASSEANAKNAKIGIWAQTSEAQAFGFQDSPPARSRSRATVTPANSITDSDIPARPLPKRSSATKPPPSRPNDTGDNSYGDPSIGQTATGLTIHEGPRGGHYHISPKSGKKVYEKKK